MAEKGHTSEILCERLKQARREVGLSLKTVAEKLGVSDSTTVWRYEKGLRGVSTVTLNALAGIYGRPVQWFYGEAQVGEIGEPQVEYATERPTIADAELSEFLELGAQLTPENRRALRPAIQRLLENQQEIDGSLTANEGRRQRRVDDGPR